MTYSSSDSNKFPVDDQDWYVIACRIRNQNKKLKEKIKELEDILEEQQEQINGEVLKNQDYDDLLQEQEEIKLVLEEEINNYQEQILQQKQQIETQQANISQLTQELEKVQQQAARLERECSLLQDNYHEEQNKLKQIEAENKDLRIRLQRQQRYNLQYKTALDQFLDNSNIPSRDSKGLGIKSWGENDSDNQDDSNNFGLTENNDDDFWQSQSPVKSENLSSNDSSSNSTIEDNSETESKETNVEENKNQKKPFIKLPQFGIKKKYE
jgi:hypothetical protein